MAIKLSDAYDFHLASVVARIECDPDFRQASIVGKSCTFGDALGELTGSASRIRQSWCFGMQQWGGDQCKRRSLVHPKAQKPLGTDDCRKHDQHSGVYFRKKSARLNLPLSRMTFLDEAVFGGERSWWLFEEARVGTQRCRRGVWYRLMWSVRLVCAASDTVVLWEGGECGK